MAYCFTGYWEDIGTIKTFFEANLKCCFASAPFVFKDPRTGFVITSPRHLPPANVDDCIVEDTILSFGAEVERSTLDNCIIGLRAMVRRPPDMHAWRLRLCAVAEHKPSMLHARAECAFESSGCLRC